MLKSSVETELLKDSLQEVLDHLSEMTPLRRLGRPVDIAAAVLFLVSLDGEWINGQTIRVNGGRFTSRRCPNSFFANPS